MTLRPTTRLFANLRILCSVDELPGGWDINVNSKSMFATILTLGVSVVKRVR